MENIENPLLHTGFKIDQDIAAADQINPAKWRVGKQVLNTENDGRTQLRANDIVLAIRAFNEMAMQPCGRHSRGNADRVVPQTANIEGIVIGIGRENLNRAMFACAAQPVKDHHCHGVCLFASRAAGNPDSNGFIALFAGHHGCNHFCVECRPGLGIAKELGNPNQQIANQRIHFNRVFLQDGDIR